MPEGEPTGIRQNQTRADFAEKFAELIESRDKLETLLRPEAFYVQLAMKNNLTALLSSGYEPVSGRTPSEPLGAPVVLKIANMETTRLALRVSPVPNARAYEVRKMNGTGGWVGGGIGTKSRRLVVDGLVPGSTRISCRCGPSAEARARVRGAIPWRTWRRELTDA